MGRTHLATFVSTTAYGSWLPGDLRGYVEDGVILPPNPDRIGRAKQLMGERASVNFTDGQQLALFDSLQAAANEFDYVLSDVSIESWHLHWIIQHGSDPVPDMVGRLKNRMRQALDVGRIWTVGYHDRMLYDEPMIESKRRYIARHAGCRMSDGVVVAR